MSENFGELKQDYMKPSEKEKVLSLFNECKDSLEKMMGIKLSNIESVGLKQITQEVVRSISEDGAGFMDQVGSYYAEIYDRFLQNFYDGIRFDELPTDKQGNFDDATKEYFKMKQKEKHLL